MFLMSVADAVEPQIDDLVEAVKTLDKAYLRWTKSKDDDFPEYLATICAGISCLVTTGFPKDDRLVGLYTSCIALAAAYQGVLEENPGSELALIGAIESVRKHLDTIEQEDEAPVQSVASMLSEWKGSPLRYQWVAKAFGEYDGDEDKWRGPFFNGNGVPRQDLIEKEAATPGSVLGENYRPASIRLKAERMRAAALKRLQGLQAGLFRPEGGAKPEKATVLEMLQDGQYADVISRVKKVPLSEVLEIAKANGVTVASRDDVLGRAALESQADPKLEALGYVKPSYDDPDDLPLDDDDDQPFDVDTTVESDPFDIDDEPVMVSQKITPEELSEFVLQYLAENEDASMHDILGAAVTSTGKDVSRQMLTPILKKLRG